MSCRCRQIDLKNYNEMKLVRREQLRRHGLVADPKKPKSTFDRWVDWYCELDDEASDKALEEFYALSAEIFPAK